MPGRIIIRVTTPVIKYMLSLIENANFIICTVVKLSNSSIIAQSCSRVQCQGLEYSTFLIVCLGIPLRNYSNKLEVIPAVIYF